MWVITRHRVSGSEELSRSDPSGGPTWLNAASAALSVLAEQPGYCGGWVGRALDRAEAGVLATEWDSVGSYRRALSTYDVKLHAWPFLATALDEPSAYETLHTHGPEGLGLDVPSLRADDADVVALRRDRGAGESGAGGSAG